MKTRFTLALSMLAGAALGGAAIQALHAQVKPPVYVIAINEVSDQERYAKEYVSPAQKSVKITAASMSRQDQEHRLRETYLTGQLSSFAGKAWRRSKVGSIRPIFRLH
jgi:uncharacterized membrane protein YoaK (UPF0700 family)